MNPLDYLYQKVTQISNYINEIRANSKRIDELPNTTDGTKLLAAWNNSSGTTEKITRDDLVNQNNRPIERDLGLLPGNGILTPAEIRDYFISVGISFNISEITSIVFIKAQKKNGLKTYNYLFYLLLGKGVWGFQPGQTPFVASVIRSLYERELIPTDINPGPNVQITNLGQIDSLDDFINTANENSYDFSDPNISYYMSYSVIEFPGTDSEKEVLYLSQFIGTPGQYGGTEPGATLFTDDDFINTANSNIQPIDDSNYAKLIGDNNFTGTNDFDGEVTVGSLTSMSNVNVDGQVYADNATSNDALTPLGQILGLLTGYLKLSGELYQDVQGEVNIQKLTVTQSPSDPNDVTTKTYVDGLALSGFRIVGGWDASTGSYPVSGSGSGGSIRRGDSYYTTVAGTINGQFYDIGDSFFSLVNSPGQTPSNWGRFEVPAGQATAIQAGIALLFDTLGTSTIGSVTQRLLTATAALKANDNNVVHLTGNETKVGTLTLEDALYMGKQGSAKSIYFNRASDGGAVSSIGYPNPDSSSEFRISSGGGGAFTTFWQNGSEKGRLSENGNFWAKNFSNLANKRWCVFGDSFSNDIGSDYPAVVIRNLDLIATGHAVSGHKLSQQLAILKGLISSNPDYLQDFDIVSLHVGANDYAASIALGTFQSVIGDGTFAGDLRDFIETCLLSNPKAKIFIITPPEANGQGVPYKTSNLAGWTIEDLGILESNICYDYSVQCIDLYSLSQFNLTTIPFFTADLLHPNSEYGIEWLGNIVSQAFLSNNNKGRSVDTELFNVVHLTGNETISGVKTFSSSPIVPIATTNFQAIPFAQVNTLLGAYIKQGGNSYGNPVTIGTLDNNTLRILINSIVTVVFGTGQMNVGGNGGYNIVNATTRIGIGINFLTYSATPSSGSTAAAHTFTKVSSSNTTVDIASFMGGTSGSTLLAGVRNDGSIYGQNPNVDLDMVNLGTLKTYTGWAQYTDTIYTSGSPFTVTSGSTSTLPNNAGTVLNTQLPTGVTSWYNPATNKITPSLDGDYYITTIRFKAMTTAPTAGYFDFGVDIGGALGVQFKETKIFAKGAGIEHNFSVIVPMFAAATFIANGGLVKITAGNGNMTIYDISFQIDRTHKSK